MRPILLLVILLTLTACSSMKDAIPAQCNAMCFQPCVAKDGDTGVRWDAKEADPGAWDALGGDVIDQLATKLRTCETRRQSCTQCLERLRDQKLITL